MFQVGDLVVLSNYRENDEEYVAVFLKNLFLKNFTFPVRVEAVDDDLIRIRTIDGDLEGWFWYRFDLATPAKIYEYEELI
jgi:hypothetical protein